MTTFGDPNQGSEHDDQGSPNAPILASVTAPSSTPSPVSPVSAATNLLFPPRCWVCGSSGQLDHADRQLVCDACQQKISPADQPRCFRCGTAVISWEAFAVDADCPACRQDKLNFVRCVTLGKYKDDLRVNVLLAKRADHELVARGLGTLLARRLRSENERLTLAQPQRNLDVVVPVPMHWLKRVFRGSNHTEAMASGVCRGLQSRDSHPRLLLDGLQTTRWTQTQSRLGKTARRKNMRNAFRACPRYNLQGLRVGLVDDIFTTGFTAVAATRALITAGVHSVTLLVASRANDPI